MASSFVLAYLFVLLPVHCRPGKLGRLEMGGDPGARRRNSGFGGARWRGWRGGSEGDPTWAAYRREGRCAGSGTDLGSAWRGGGLGAAVDGGETCGLLPCRVPPERRGNPVMKAEEIGKSKGGSSGLSRTPERRGNPTW